MVYVKSAWLWLCALFCQIVLQDLNLRCRRRKRHERRIFGDPDFADLGKEKGLFGF